MNQSQPAAEPAFEGVLPRVMRRLWLRKFFLCIMRSLPFMLGAQVSIIMLRAWGVMWSGVGLSLALTLLWIAGCFIFAWWHRPEPYAALAFWDQQAGRGDDFANAWWFETQKNRDVGQEYHWRAQSALLPDALPSLRKDVALPDVRRAIAVPLLLLVLAIFSSGRGLLPRDAMLTEEGMETARHEGRKLAEKKLDADKMKALDEDEKKELEKLQQNIAESAKSLGQQKEGTAREVLSELEKRARDAEKLAEKLSAGSDAWASEQMVAELRKHADTAELGDAVANKSTEGTATEAEKLAGQLRDEKLTNEARGRMTETLKNAGKQAQPEDKDRTVGQHVIAADKNLAQTLPRDAGEEFQKLADKMKALAAREKAREQLENLAQQLRNAGSNIAGQGAKGMQQLARSQQQQNQSGQGTQGQMMNMQNAPQMQPMQMPGLSSAPQGQGQSQQGQGSGQSTPLFAPVPGTGQQGKGQQGNSQAMSPGGQGQNPNGKPSLIAPIPGTNPGQQPNAALLGVAPGMVPGGFQAGSGTTGIGNSPTEKTQASQQSTVNARRNEEGESTVRSIEGQAHTETAARSSQATVLEAITQEENALDDAPLPAARREQVRRYFTELRKRFENEN